MKWESVGEMGISEVGLGAIGGGGRSFRRNQGNSIENSLTVRRCIIIPIKLQECIVSNLLEDQIIR